MKQGERAKKLAAEWFEKGMHDFSDAVLLLRNGGYTDTICFHCQQAAEKYIKGFLVFNRVKPKLVHNLLVLLRQCFKVDSSFKDLSDECRLLTQYYIESRYPLGAPILYTKEEAEGALKAGERIINFIKEKCQ